MVSTRQIPDQSSEDESVTTIFDHESRSQNVHEIYTISGHSYVHVPHFSMMTIVCVCVFIFFVVLRTNDC